MGSDLRSDGHGRSSKVDSYRNLTAVTNVLRSLGHDGRRGKLDVYKTERLSRLFFLLCLSFTTKFSFGGKASLWANHGSGRLRSQVTSIDRAGGVFDPAIQRWEDYCMAERRRVACPGRSLSAKGNFGFGIVIFSFPLMRMATEGGWRLRLGRGGIRKVRGARHVGSSFRRSA